MIVIAEHHTIWKENNENINILGNVHLAVAITVAGAVAVGFIGFGATMGIC